MAIEKERVIEIPKELIEPSWNTNKVKIKRWTAGIRATANNESWVMKITPGQKEFKDVVFDASRYQLVLFLHQVVEAPWLVGNVGVVNELDPAIIDLVSNEITKLNGATEKNSNASDVSSEAKPVQA